MQTIEIYRANTIILEVKPNDNSNVKQAIMGDWLLTLQFDIDREIELRIGDYTTVYGNTYYVHATQMPVVTKKGTYLYEYDLQMVSCQYLLQNAQYLFLGNEDNSLTQPDWTLHGTANDFIDLLIQNANRTGYTFEKGSVIQTGYKDLTFSNVDCYSALSTLAQEFNTEWFVEDFKVYLAKKQKQRPFTFKYGKNKGLYDIKRTPADSVPIVTRLYVFGSEKNIPTGYRNGSTRLLLPAVSSTNMVSGITYTVTNLGNGKQTMTFNWTAPSDNDVIAVTIQYRLTTGASTTFINLTGGKNSPQSLTVPAGTYEVMFRSELSGGGTITTPSIIVAGSSQYEVLPGDARAYIEHNTDIFGVIERTLILDDIYPHRTGIVTATNAIDPFSFTDDSIDFDINNQLLPGTSAKVTFNTGQLAGWTFEIRAYDNAGKTVTLLKNKDEKAIDVPSFVLHPEIGDEYVFTDIVMPQAYIDAAESMLLVKAQEYLNSNSVPNFNYTVTCDAAYFRRKNITLSYGDVIWITDTELNLDMALRIISVTRALTDEYNYQIELSNAGIKQGTIAAIQAGQSGNSNSISNINDALNNNKLLAGTNVGNFTVEQGSLLLKDIEVAADISAMRQLYIDANGKVWAH